MNWFGGWFRVQRFSVQGSKVQRFRVQRFKGCWSLGAEKKSL